MLITSGSFWFKSQSGCSTSIVGPEATCLLCEYWSHADSDDARVNRDAEEPGQPDENWATEKRWGLNMG